MTAFDGALDAPPARDLPPVGALCIEPHCARPRHDWNHDEKNPNSHFYHAAGDALLTVRGGERRKASSPRVEMTPPAAPRPAGRAKSVKAIAQVVPPPARVTEPENAPTFERFIDQERERVIENARRRNGDPRRCDICGSARSRHRGRTDHKFIPASEIRPRNGSEVLAEIERTLEPMAKWTRVDDFVVRPNYAEGAREPHSVRISIDVTLFYTEEA